MAGVDVAPTALQSAFWRDKTDGNSNPTHILAALQSIDGAKNQRDALFKEIVHPLLGNAKLLLADMIPGLSTAQAGTDPSPATRADSVDGLQQQLATLDISSSDRKAVQAGASRGTASSGPNRASNQSADRSDRARRQNYRPSGDSTPVTSSRAQGQGRVSTPAPGGQSSANPKYGRSKDYYHDSGR